MPDGTFNPLPDSHNEREESMATEKKFSADVIAEGKKILEAMKAFDIEKLGFRDTKYRAMRSLNLDPGKVSRHVLGFLNWKEKEYNKKRTEDKDAEAGLGPFPPIQALEAAWHANMLTDPDAVSRLPEEERDGYMAWLAGQQAEQHAARQHKIQENLGSEQGIKHAPRRKILR